MNQNKVKILVACHKKDIIPNEEPYFPIHVGKTLHPDACGTILGDDTGDNISVKNSSYCELTALYWAWKNLIDTDIIGLCHYRRYFDLNSFSQKDREPIKGEMFPKLNVDNCRIALKKYDIILPGRCFIPCSIRDAYAIGHSMFDYNEIEKAIKKIYPEYLLSFQYVSDKQNYYTPYNMFICKKSVFDNYCEWLFKILEEVERNTDISKYDNYQSRIYGFMGERLLNVYVHAHNMKVLHRPVVALIDAETPSFIKQILHRIKVSIAFKLSRS